MAEIVSILQADLVRAVNELSVLDAKRAQLTWRIEYIQRLLHQRDADEPRKIVQDSGNKIPDSYSGMTTLDVILAVLKAAGEPLRVSEIAKRAIYGGYDSGSRDIDKAAPNMSSTISRSIRDDPNTPFQREPKARVGLKVWHPKAE